MAQPKPRKPRNTAFECPCYYLDSRGRDRLGDQSPLKAALDLLRRIANDRQTGCAIVVNTKDRIGQRSEFERSVGSDIANRLRKGEDVEFGEVRMTLLTSRGRSTNFDRGPVLALYIHELAPFREYFEEGRITDLIFVPWTPQDLERFLSDFPDARPLQT